MWEELPISRECLAAFRAALLSEVLHRASAIYLQAATLTGIQTTTNRATTGIGLSSLIQPSAFQLETTSPIRAIVLPGLAPVEGCGLTGFVEILLAEVLADEKARDVLVLQTVEKPA